MTAAVTARWFEIYNQNRPVVELYVAAHSARRSYMEQKFQYAMAAAEGVATAFAGPLSPTSADLMDAKARAVYEVCPPELKTWLLPRIATTLRRQLRAMWKPSVFGSFFPNAKLRNEVLEAVVTERSNLAHGSLGRSSQRLSGEQLYWATELLLFAVERSLLMAAGISPVLVDTWLARSGDFNLASSRLPRAFAE